MHECISQPPCLPYKLMRFVSCCKKDVYCVVHNAWNITCKWCTCIFTCTHIHAWIHSWSKNIFLLLWVPCMHVYMYMDAYIYIECIKNVFLSSHVYLELMRVASCCMHRTCMTWCICICKYLYTHSCIHDFSAAISALIPCALYPSCIEYVWAQGRHGDWKMHSCFINVDNPPFPLQKECMQTWNTSHALCILRV